MNVLDLITALVLSSGGSSGGSGGGSSDSNVVRKDVQNHCYAIKRALFDEVR